MIASANAIAPSRLGYRRWAERVEAWLRAHEVFGKDFMAMRYARHVAACDRAGVEPVPDGVWSVERRTYVEDKVRSAARILASYDEAREVAKARGVGITVDYEANEKVPRSRDAARAAAKQGSVIDLRKYRERRP